MCVTNVLMLLLCALGSWSRCNRCLNLHRITGFTDRPRLDQRDIASRTNDSVPGNDMPETPRKLTQLPVRGLCCHTSAKYSRACCHVHRLPWFVRHHWGDMRWNVWRCWSGNRRGLEVAIRFSWWMHLQYQIRRCHGHRCRLSRLLPFEIPFRTGHSRILQAETGLKLSDSNARN